MITKEILESAYDGEILISGYFIDSGDTNISNTGKRLRWLAVRGMIPDWTIYFEDPFGWYDWEDDRIKNIWYKFPKNMVNGIVKLGDWVLDVYRI